MEQTVMGDEEMIFLVGPILLGNLFCDLRMYSQDPPTLSESCMSFMMTPLSLLSILIL